MMTTFEQAVINEVKRIREILGATDMINRFEFTIKAEGRCLDGDVELKYIIASDYDADVKGNSINGVLAEVKRRKVWQENNNPICIGKVEESF